MALGLAILVTRPFGTEFLPLSRSLTNLGQTFPPVAVLALAVPALGFDAGLTLVALFLYGLLPIFENALTGFTARRQRSGPGSGPDLGATSYAGRTASGSAGDPGGACAFRP